MSTFFDRILSTLPVSDDAGVEIEIRRTGIDCESWGLAIDQVERAQGQVPAALASTLVSEINQRAATSWTGPVTHAGGVSYRGRGIVLPAEPESGKSTLTAGLVRAGFDYLTDEGVAFREGTTVAEPYPKPLSLDAGSWFLFPELAPDDDLDDGDFERTQWQVPVTAIRPDSVAEPCVVRFIVFPKYVEGAATEIVPIRRAEALVELAKNTFDFNEHSREYLDHLAIVVRACDCYRMTVGDLDDAIALIQQLFADG